MKRNLVLLAFVISLFGTVSCNKDVECQKTYPIEGLWIGTYTINEIPQQGALYYSFVVKPEGVLLTEGLGGDGRTYYAT